MKNEGFSAKLTQVRVCLKNKLYLGTADRLSCKKLMAYSHQGLRLKAI